MVRESLARVLSENDRIVVVGQCSSGAEACALVESNPDIDILVMDYSMPGMEAIELIRQVKQQRETIQCLVLTVHENVRYAVRVLQNGASGFVIKASAVAELVDAIRACRRGETFVSPAIRDDVFRELQATAPLGGSLDELAPREREFLTLLAAGHNIKACSDIMQVSHSTASTYRTRIMDKLGLESTQALIRFAQDHGLGDL